MDVNIKNKIVGKMVSQNTESLDVKKSSLKRLLNRIRNLFMPSCPFY